MGSTSDRAVSTNDQDDTDDRVTRRRMLAGTAGVVTAAALGGAAVATQGATAAGVTAGRDAAAGAAGVVDGAGGAAGGLVEDLVGGVVGQGPKGAGLFTGWQHALGDPRGSEIAIRGGRSKEGRYGLLFKGAEKFSPPDELLLALARQMAEPGDAVLDNPDIPAGFTFLGQFIDHDMTQDRTPMPEQEIDPLALTNFATPRFDLDSLYGRGRDADPQIYEPGWSGRLQVVRNANGVDDLPRREGGGAICGDPRNDENLIVSQIHLLFVKFHNRLLETGTARHVFEAQELTRHHFQWIIVNDFLRHVVGSATLERFLRYDRRGRPRYHSEFYRPRNRKRPMMPIEYSVAAYRFGHSIIRPHYLLNMRTTPPSGAPIFGSDGNDLRGSRPLPAKFEIDWQHFFEVPGRPAGPRNKSRLIDGKLSPPLLNLPKTVVGDGMASLAERNLLRGKRLGLPAGQDVAEIMDVRPYSNAELGLPDPKNQGWGGKAPLWYYLLKEAELQTGGRRLGEIGGRIVAEVMLGVLDVDRESYFNVSPAFVPVPPIASAPGEFRMGDLVRFAQGY